MTEVSTDKNSRSLQLEQAEFLDISDESFWLSEGDDVWLP